MRVPWTARRSNQSMLREISPEYSSEGLMSCRIDWFDILAVQGNLNTLLQHHSSKASIFQCSAFFIVQLSHPYMTTGKTITLTRQTFVGKVIPLLFIKLSRLVITFLPKSKHLLISWLQSPSAVISDQISRSVVSDSLQTHELQHARPPCPSPTPRVYSSSPLNRCHPTISSSVIPFSSFLQSFPPSRSFPVSQFFASGGQSIGASASVLPMNIQD